MQTKFLGNTDQKIGTIAYGCWRFAGTKVNAAQEKIETALDQGMTLIDTADIYGFGEPAGFGGSESLLGEVFAASPALRDKCIVATKGGITPPTPYNADKDYLIMAVEKSLQRLQIETVDLYQIHRPDLLAPVEQTAKALSEIVVSGKARFIGVSNYTTSQTRALQAHLDFPLVSCQPEFSALEQSPITDGTLDWCAETGATCLAWSPLARGQLTQKVSSEDDIGSRLNRVRQALDAIAKKYEVTLSQAALVFVLRHPAHIVPIIGTQSPDRIREAAKAAQVELQRQDWYSIVEAYRGEKMP